MKPTKMVAVIIGVLALFFSSFIQNILINIVSERVKIYFTELPFSIVAFGVVASLCLFILHFLVEKILQSIRYLPTPVKQYEGYWFCYYTSGDDCETVCSLLTFNYNYFFQYYNFEVIDYCYDGERLSEITNGRFCCKDEWFQAKDSYYILRCSVNVNTQSETIFYFQITTPSMGKDIARGLLHRREYTRSGGIQELEGNISLIMESELIESFGKNKVKDVLSEEECLRLVSNYYSKYVKNTNKVYRNNKEKQIKNNDDDKNKKGNLSKIAGKNIRVCFRWKEESMDVEINEKITAMEAVKELISINFIPDESVDSYYFQVLGGNIFSKKLSFGDAGVKDGDCIKIYKKEYE